MGPEVAIPLVLSVITAIAVGSRNLLGSYSKQIVLLTRLDENVKLCQVGIESLKIIDVDTSTKLRHIEKRLDDMERYLQLASSCDFPHPFTPRQATKPD